MSSRLPLSGSHAPTLGLRSGFTRCVNLGEKAKSNGECVLVTRRGKAEEESLRNDKRVTADFA